MSRMSTGSALCRLPLFALPAVLALTLLLPAPIPAADTAAPAPDAAQAAESGPSPEERSAEAVLGEVQSALDSKDYKKPSHCSRRSPKTAMPRPCTSSAA